MANIIHSTTQNSIKKQLNDMWLYFSYDIHKELYSLSVERVTGTNTTLTSTTASGTQLLFQEVVGPKLWEKKNTANALGHDGLEQTAGESVMLVCRNPIGSKDITIFVPYTTVGNIASGTTVTIKARAGKNQATWLGDGPAGTDVIIPNVIKVGNNTAGAGIQVTGATRGDNFKFMSFPTAWNYQSFVRAITPNTPKNYTEVADHFDGAADTIRTTVINGLTLSRVFEDIPGSFLMLTDRTVTVKAEVRELDKTVASEVYYFTGCRGTGKVTVNRDGESITEAEMSMVDWVTVTGI